MAVVQADFKASGKKASKDLYQGEEYVTRLTDENWDDKVRALSSGGETLYCTTHPTLGAFGCSLLRRGGWPGCRGGEHVRAVVFALHQGGA